MNRQFDAEKDGELLSAYLDDALGPKEKAYVEILLIESVEAHNTFQEMVRFKKAFQQWEPEKPDAFFLRRVEARIAEEATVYKARLPWGKHIQRFAVAAMVLLTIGGLAFLTHLRQDSVVHVDLETFLSGFLDQDVEQVAVLTESDMSKDVVLDLILTENIR